MSQKNTGVAFAPNGVPAEKGGSIKVTLAKLEVSINRLSYRSVPKSLRETQYSTVSCFVGYDSRC